MTSSEPDNQPQSPPAPQPDRRYSRRLKWVAIIIALLAAGYSAAWFVIANRVEKGIDAGIAEMREEDGVTADCAGRNISGFPFRFELNCDSISYDNPHDDVAFQAGSFHGARQIHDLALTVGELKGPLNIKAPFALNLNWSQLHASIREARPLPARASFDAWDLQATDPASAAVKTLFQSKHVETHMRTEGEAVDLAARFEALRIEPEVVEGRILPPLTGVFDLSITNGVAMSAQQPMSLRGATAQLRILSIAIEGGGSVNSTGPVTIGTDGLIDAELKVAIVNAAAVSDALQTAIPEQANSIRTAFAALALLGDQPTLPLTIRKGEARLGFIPLGNIAPLN